MIRTLQYVSSHNSTKECLQTSMLYLEFEPMILCTCNTG